MLGWCGLGFLFVVSIISFYLREKRRTTCDDGLGMLVTISLIVGLVVSAVCIPVDFYAHRVEAIPKLEAFGKTISETKSLIETGKEINLESMEVVKRLSEVIQERNEYVASLKAAQKNPFCLFKPTVELD